MKTSSQTWRLALAWAILLLMAGCWSKSSSSPNGLPASPGPATGASGDQSSDTITLALHDVTDLSGVSAVYENGDEAGAYSILESIGGGVGVLDYDRDGQPDLFFPGGGTLDPQAKTVRGLPATLWRASRPWRFDEVSQQAGIRAATYYSHGCAGGDFNNDGFPDVLVTGYGGLQLFQNQGDGSFLEITQPSQLLDKQWSSSAAWGDFDADGNLDLYVTHYVDWSWENHPRCPTSQPGQYDVCSPREFSGLNDVLYLSNGDGTFRDATAEAGLAEGGKGLGVIAADVNMDGALDIYVANDTVNNFLYLNDGTGRFQELGLVSGTAVDHRGIANGSMGLAVFDYDLNLSPDIWVTNYENETFGLYRNEGSANFLCVSEAAGVTVLGGLYVGFGTVAVDLELDGDEDIAIANGHVVYHPRHRPGPQEAIVLRNGGRGRFFRENFARDSYFSKGHWGRGVALADLDGDRDGDLVFSNSNQPAALLRNDTKTPHTALVTELVGTRCNRDTIGAHLVLETSTGKYYRTVCGGGSYLSQSAYQQIWGIPQGATIHQLTITWPGGRVQQVPGAQLSGSRTLIEPSQ